MSTTRGDYVAGCDEILRARPKYQLGASDLKECDCIGMDKYSFRKNKVPFSTTGTNWTFRNQVRNKREIHSASDLKFGDVVFKCKEPHEQGYNLPSKYRPGGSAFNGDLNDYCHIGTVKSVNPLRIIHMTSPTAKTDTTIGKWKWCASWKEQYVRDDSIEPSDPVPEPEPNKDTATVYAESDRWVKMRKEPSTKCRLYDEVPVGATVKIDVFGYEWCKISYGKRHGWYMMTKFLIVG